MPLTIFSDKEKEYRNWLDSNPSGYVLSTTKDISVEYMSLHRSTCQTISQYMSSMAKDAFTGKKYIKVCSSSPDELSKWISRNGGKGFTKFCSKCNPDVSGELVDELRELQDELEEKIRISAKLTSHERTKRLTTAAKKPETKMVLTKIFLRNSDVVVEVLKRANGVCEACSIPAPFMRKKDKTPYLEVHHRIQLAKDGEDTVENAEALCPNCHRERHYG